MAAGSPFRARGRVDLAGAPPFAQPILILDDGTVYQLAGPMRGACTGRRGESIDVSGVVIGGSSSPGVRAVIRVETLGDGGAR